MAAQASKRVRSRTPPTGWSTTALREETDRLAKYLRELQGSEKGRLKERRHGRKK